MFTIILGFSAFFVALCGAYFSVIGIASLFSGSFFQVAVMASSLELGKLVATSFLYRYWKNTSFFLRAYLLTAIFTLMVVTSAGIFGYLSAAYQINSSKFSQINSQITLIESQKSTLDVEINQNQQRIETLNRIRTDQEKRVQEAGNYKLPREQAYDAIKKADNEIQVLTQRNQEVQQQKSEKDSNILQLSGEINKTKDIGTFNFVAEAINKPLDFVVIAFICILICVFDPLAVTLLLAFNIAIKSKETSFKPIKAKQSVTQPISTPALTPVPTVDSIPTENQLSTEDVSEEVFPEVIKSSSQISPEPTSRIWFSPEVNNKD